ncbi:unnamed protein product [Diamesa hyperborea]
MDNIECINDSNTNGYNYNTNNEDDDNDNDEEEFNEQSLLITNKITTTTSPSTVPVTAKECHDACMEPLLIQNCVDDDFITNPINDTNCVFNDNLIINDDNDDKQQPSEHDLISYEHESIPLDSGGGGGGNDEVINNSKFISNDNTPTNEPEDVDADADEENDDEEEEEEEEHLESVDFFNRKIEEDETFDTTFTDTADNYQENETNLCSLNENFNENYCSFSSVDYNAENHQQIKQESTTPQPTEDDDSTEPETKCYLYSEQMKSQRPSIVIDCYDSDSSKKDDEEDAEVENNEKMNDYCFYFDQTIEEDDDDIVNDVVYLNGTEGEGDFVKINGIEMDIVEVAYKEEFVEVHTNTERVEQSHEEIETEETYVEEQEEELVEEEDGDEEEIDTEEDQLNEDDDKSSAVESFESASTVVKKVVKKSVKKTTTSKKNTISTTESSSITSSKAASFENSSVNKKKTSNGVGSLKKKTKKSKKSDEKENNHISVKSSFSKFDALQKKNLQNLQRGGEANGSSTDLEKKCHACTKVVFQMEQIKAEKKFWHRACFKCSVNECNKQLNVDTYQSHEGVLYCKAHFKSLFAPKVVEDSPEPVKPRKMEMIIRENQPMELPADVVRSSDKADLGLEELQQLNVRSRFQVFENASQQESKVEVDRSSNGVKRSTSILSKLARFQAKGMDVGVVDESLNGICYEQSSSEEEEEYDDDENQEDIELIRAKRAQKERPMSFANMNEMKIKFEAGHQQCKEERREERKQELQNIRSRLFLGKQARTKEMYQQAVADSEVTITAAGKKTDLDISDNAKLVREKFEKGDFENEDNDSRRTLKDEEMSVFEQGIGKQSRSLFLELDASASKSPSIQQSPSSATINTGRQTTRQNSQIVLNNDSIVRCDSKMEDILVENADIVSKFKFFETYKPDEKEKKKFRITPPRDGVAKLPTPEKELYRDPHLARNDVTSTEDESMEVAEKSHTASKMLSMFRQLEEHKEQRPTGPKPLKRFTPPPDENRRINPNEDSGPEYSDDEDYDDEEECEEEEEEEEEEELNPNYVKSSLKNVDEFLKAAQSAERAKHLRNKFEKWEQNEIKREMNNSSVNLFEANNDEGQVESAKSLRARFEQMQNDAEPKLPPTRIKVNRFV